MAPRLKPFKRSKATPIKQRPAPPLHNLALWQINYDLTLMGVGPMTVADYNSLPVRMDVPVYKPIMQPGSQLSGLTNSNQVTGQIAAALTGQSAPALTGQTAAVYPSPPSTSGSDSAAKTNSARKNAAKANTAKTNTAAAAPNNNSVAGSTSSRPQRSQGARALPKRFME